MYGDRLRELLQVFAARALEAKKVYQQARDERLAPSVLVLRRAKWKAWLVAWHEFAQGFDWSSVPTTVPLEARQLLAAEQRRKTAELSALMERIRARTRGTTGVDEELRRLRGGDL